MSEVERGTSKDKYISGGGKRTNVDQKSGLPTLRSKIKRLFTLSGGRKLEAEHVVIHGSEVEEKTFVHELNPRNQEAVDDLSTRELLPQIKERGVDTEAIAILRNNKYYLIEGSRRRFCCIECSADLPMWVFNEELSSEDITCIYTAAQTSKRFSYREMGLKYLEMMRKNNFTTNEELATYIGISIESVRKRVQAAQIDKVLISIFPDCEAIPNTFYSKLAKIEKTAKEYYIQLTDITSEVRSDNNDFKNSNDIEEIQRSILNGLQSALQILTNDTENKQVKWTISNIADFDNKDMYARIKRSRDGRKVHFEFNRLNKSVIDEIERLVKVSINKSK